MTIQEAIKSGKPFKRPKDVRYMMIGKWGFLEYEPKGKRERGARILFFSVSELLAEDWEVKP